MIKGFKSISVPKNVKLVAATEPDELPTVVTVADTEHVCDDDCDHDSVNPAPSTVVGPHHPELTEKFLLAGRAVFTVSNPAGDHYTFKVRRVESEWPKYSGKMTTTYFVNVKTAKTDHPYGYIGILDAKKGTIKCTAKSEFLPGTKEYSVAAWACQAVVNAKMIPDGYHIEHAGRCGKCGRQLTDPESIQRGIGPECWSMIETAALAPFPLPVKTNPYPRRRGYRRRY